MSLFIQIDEKFEELEKKLFKRLDKIIGQQQDSENNPKMRRLDNADVMLQYKVGAKTLAKWRAEGLVFSKIGAKYYYLEQDLETFMEAHKVNNSVKQSNEVIK